MQYRGLFVGLTTLDSIYLSDRPVTANQKVVALDYLSVAGGPATNAAIAFGYFGNRSRLLSAIGRHPLTSLIRHDLEQHVVSAIDLMPDKSDSPPVSAIVVDAATGKRAIISINAVKSQAQAETIAGKEIKDCQIVLIDGHQLEVSLKIAAIAKSHSIPVVLDGGSWKPGLEKLLPNIDYAICSADFAPPDADENIFGFLADYGVKRAAITQGEKPILYQDAEINSTIAVPIIPAVDTLGAGDIFHGAFCHYILQADFPTALKLATEIASRSCMSFGTRSWMKYDRSN